VKALTGWRLELFEKHTAWAKGMGASVVRKLPPCFDRDEIEQACLIGLMKACSKYRRNAPVPFRAFAHVYVQKEPFMAVRRKEYTERTHVEITHDVPCEAAPAHLPERDETLLAAIRTLQPNERSVIEQHFLFGVGLANLADRFGVRRSEIEQLRDGALARLREAMSAVDRKQAS